MTATELARELRCARSTVYELARRGMPHIRLGNRRGIRFDREAALEWLRQRAERMERERRQREASEVVRALQAIR